MLDTLSRAMTFVTPFVGTIGGAVLLVGGLLGLFGRERYNWPRWVNTALVIAGLSALSAGALGFAVRSIGAHHRMYFVASELASVLSGVFVGLIAALFLSGYFKQSFRGKSSGGKESS